MSDHQEHENIIKAASDQLRKILEGSTDSIYIYLDDTHKLANKNFADLLEYASAEEWASVTDPFTEMLADEKSQHTLVHAYSKAIEKMAGSQIQVSWKTKTGKIIDTNVIIVPISINGQLLALHFVEKS